MYIRIGMAVGGGETNKEKSVKNRKYRLRRNMCIILVPQFFCLCTLSKYLEKLYTLLHIFKATSIIFHGKRGEPGKREQIKPRRVWEHRGRKPRPLSSLLPPCCDCQWNSITRPPSHPRGRRHLPYPSPTQCT